MFQIIRNKSLDFPYLLKTLANQYGTYSTGRLILTPTSCDMTQSIDICGEGFSPKTPLTIQNTLRCQSEYLDFESFAHITTGSDGKFDMSKTESTGGTYTGTDGMGLFWSMEKKGESQERVQLNNGLTKLKYQFKLFEDHVDNFDANEICFEECTRYFANENVSRRSVKEGNIVGTLFEPSGKGRFPAIITLHGGNKKRQMVEDTAAMLAGQGFVTFALAFFGVEGLPKTYTESPIKVEYFEETVKYLSALPKVDFHSIGVYGESKGGDISFAMMSHLPQVKAVCSVNASISSIGTTTTYGDFTTDMLTPHFDRVSFFEDETLNIRNALTNPRDEPSSIHPFETSSANLLMIAGLDDYNWHSELMADIAQERMDAAGKRNYKILKYPGLGHFVDAPFTPVCTVFAHPLTPKGMLVYFGGRNKSQHAENQAAAWKEVFSFFKASLKSSQEFS